MISDYSSDIFKVRDIRSAKNIILTPQGGMTPDDRWETETPYLVDLILRRVPGSESADRVLDYGCGIGRMSKALINKVGCVVVGVDSSYTMRALANDYVRDERFIVAPPKAVTAIVPCDFAISIWTLQHCNDVEECVKQIVSKLRIGGYLFIVNDHHRIVPNSRGGWSDDGIDLGGILSNHMTLVCKESLDPKVVGHQPAASSYWAVYRTRGD